MTTTFTSRQTIRERLATLITSTGEFAAVYDYVPAVKTISGMTPFCIVLSTGSNQQMSGINTNPVDFSFSVSVYVKRYEDANYTSQDARDKLDDLDRVIRQVVRDNAAGATVADMLLFDGSFSTVQHTEIDSTPYLVEPRTIIARLFDGC